MNSGGTYKKGKEIKLSSVYCLVQDFTRSCHQTLHNGSFVTWCFTETALFQVPGDNEKHWKPVLVVLTEKDLLMYESMPRMKEAWFSPLHTYPLLATRYLRFLCYGHFKRVEMAKAAGSRYSWCIAIYHTWNVIVWIEQQILQWANVLSLSPLVSLFQVLAEAGDQMHTIRPRSRNRSAEKAKSSFSWDSYLSMQTWGIGRNSGF